MATYYDTIIDPSREKLFSEAAEAISAINQLQSPLLRLPAELRNEIYKYVLGGMEFHIAERSPKRDQFSVTPLGRPHFRVHLHRLVGLTLASRQLYAETNLLSFELGTYALKFTLDHPMKRLSIPQRHAISTIRVAYWDIIDYRVLNPCSPVTSLTGLKRVVVFDCPDLQLVGERHLIAIINDGLGRDDVHDELEYEK